MGRPKWQPEDLGQVEALASRGLTLEQIADALGITYKTLANRRKDNILFLQALKKGQALGIKNVANALYQAALKGNITAGIFYLKCRSGWHETIVTEHKFSDNMPEPSQMTEEQIKAELDELKGKKSRIRTGIKK